ncbi:hypothetical protein HBH64_055300 [Parastagonospora nodorum]|nr:hypothetical protein HBI01_087780 [Parastagonospora nodorum]KAH4311899.1 hypothetical protein HBI02_091420 [Parastagonospora nodorum]KAH4331522.1 hypothetical protein HBI00_076640 [Parastagonospora nodorum]KAH4371411.1 hypothetical protein HBH94_113550 [Parastagonospora nodorum]KAH4467427.1 hypothetical protein HBH90_095280 [Parastagonospora nodorum]
MHKLPQELICQICSDLSPNDLCNTYYVSSMFRDAAEDYAKNHKHGRVKYPEHKASMANTYRGFRHRYIERVKFCVAPPPPSKSNEYGCCQVSRDEQHKRDEIFTAQIRDLFATLRAMEDIAGERNVGSYDLVICSVERPESSCLHNDHSARRTCLLDPKKLPDIKSVRSLKFNDNRVGIKYDYRILIDLIAHLPNASHLECHIGVDEWTPYFTDEPANCYTWDYDGPRRDTRHGFANAPLSSSSLQRLESVKLDFFCRNTMTQADYIHQYMSYPNLVCPASKDPFSTSLRILSYHLRELDLRVQVDESLFWPTDGSTATWPHLQKVRVMFHMVTPSGTYYFEGPRGEGRELMGHEIGSSEEHPEYPSDDECDVCCTVREHSRSFEDWVSFQFRICANEGVLVPFLASFAKAAFHMPALKHAVLYSLLSWDVDGDDDYVDQFHYYEPPKRFFPDSMAWGLEYCAPGIISISMTNSDIVNLKERRIRWRVGEWRPDSETHSLFQRIGLQQHGPALEEQWTDDEFGSGFVTRDYFEHDYVDE